MPNIGGSEITAIISFLCCLVLLGVIGIGVIWFFRKPPGQKDYEKVQEYDYMLDRLSEDKDDIDRYGQGYVIIRLSDDQKLDWQSLTKDTGLYSFNVAVVSNNVESLQDPSFSPGKTLSLVPEPTNTYDPSAIAVYNEDKSKKAGYLPKESPASQDFSEIARLLKEGEPFRCICIWETVKEDKRVGIRLLIALPDARIKLE